MMFDCHTHILPGIDDGSRSVEKSISMLLSMADNGVSDVFLTPHFNMMMYKNIDEFLEKRQESFDLLKSAIADIPGEDGKKLSRMKLYCGAEVAFNCGMHKADGLKKLCIDNTNCLLLELPYMPWKESVFDEVRAITEEAELSVVLVHIERFRRVNKKFESYVELHSIAAAMQINAESLFSFWDKRFCVKLIKNNMVNLLGSDCHGMTSRPPNVHLGYEFIRENFGDDVYEEFISSPKKMLEQK